MKSIKTMSSSSTTRRPKQPTTAGARKPKATAGTTPISEINMSTGKENSNNCRPESRIRAASKPQKPIVPLIIRSDSPVRPTGRSSSPSEFSISSDVKKRRGLVDRNEISVGRFNRVPSSGLDRVGINEKGLNVINQSDICNGVDKRGEICNGSKPKYVKSKNVENVNIESGFGSDSVMKVSESVKLCEKFKSKSSVRLKSSNGVENEVSGSEEGLTVRSSRKYPSNLQLVYLEEKVKRITLDSKTEEMLDLNNPDASKVMLWDVQGAVAGIEKAMGDVVIGENDKSGSKVNGSDSVEVNVVEKISPVKECGAKISTSTYNVEGNVDTMLAADETLEVFDEQEIKEITDFEVEMDDGYNNQLNEIGHKTCTGGWFFSEGELALLAHDDGSCTFYDVANSEDKSIFKAPTEASPNLWRDCWIVRAPGAEGCAGIFVVAASAGNSMEAGFCSWDFYTKEVISFYTEDVVTNTRTASAPLSNNALNRRHDLTNLTPENRQWWYKPCGPLIISTASNQRAVRIYDIRDGLQIMKWDLQKCVSAMKNSSPLQWRNKGKVVVAEAEIVSLWDVGSLTPEPLLSVSSTGKKISALHINNAHAEVGGGVRRRVSSSEAEGSDGVFCTSDSINVLDFRHPAGIGIKIPKHSSTVHSVFPRGDSIYLGCSGSPSSVRKPTSTSQIQQFSIRKQKLFSTYSLPESNAHPHYKAITQVWGNSNLTMGVCSLGLYVFDALKDDDDKKPYTSGYGNDQKVRETIGPDNLYCPSFDYLGSRALLISRDRPAVCKYLS